MIVMLNCSPRREKSNSNHFLNLLEQKLDTPCERLYLGAGADFDRLREKMQEAEAMVFAMPLYVDGAPAQVMELLERLYDEKDIRLEQKTFYMISNLGFYESRQAQIQVRIMQNWCKKMKLAYGGALVIGGGEMLGSLKEVPVDQGPNKKLGEGLVRFANAVADRKSTEDIYVEPAGFPRGMYQFAAHWSWRRWAKKNGLAGKELFRCR